MTKASRWLRRFCTQLPEGRYNAVLFHYIGSSSPHRKNLDDWQMRELCDLIIRSGRVPVLLDWERRSVLPDQKTIFSPDHPEGFWGEFIGVGDAEIISALIRLSEAFVGVDSGPSKIASATETPSLVVWTKNHPANYHDPAPNTTHLLPTGWSQREPLNGDGEMVRWFADHYRFICYDGAHGLVSEAMIWLAEILGVEAEVAAISFVVPECLDQAQWAVRKMRGIAQGRVIDVVVSGEPRREEESPVVQWWRKIPFVRSVKMREVPILHDYREPKDVRGRYRWVSDGFRNGYHYLLPGTVMESGRTLEEWLPDVAAEEVAWA
jgi:hypothetical protein